MLTHLLTLNMVHMVSTRKHEVIANATLMGIMNV